MELYNFFLGISDYLFDMLLLLFFFFIEYSSNFLNILKNNIFSYVDIYFQRFSKILFIFFLNISDILHF